LGRTTWVCATCAQYFSRRYSADRHNRILHDGKGITVRILDYIVGRVSGQFLPNDPLAYRMKVRNEENVPLVGSHSNNKNFWSKVIADSTNAMTSNSSKTLPSSQNSMKGKYPDLLAHPTRIAGDNKDSFSVLSQESVRRKLRLQEFNFLVNKFYPQQTASKILALANYHLAQGNDDFFEKTLISLRKLKIGNSFDNSVADSPSLEESYSLGFDPTLLSSKVDKKVGESQCTAEHEQAKAKLLEIEEVLAPHCPPDFVKNVVKDLIQECNRTGDYGILDEALENHRNNVSYFYLKR
jgi:hypothetical protein